MKIEMTNSVGFVINWRKSSYYDYIDNNRLKSVKLTFQSIINQAEKKGIRLFGQYNSRWSTSYEKFTFGISPNFNLVKNIFDQLDEAGIQQLYDWKLFLGLQGSGNKLEDQGHLLTDDAANSLGGNPNYPMAFYALWNRTASYYESNRNERMKSSLEITKVFDFARENGVLTFGRYESHWFCGWKFFTFWLAPNFNVLQSTFDKLERAGDFYFASPHHCMGILDNSIK